MRFLGRLAKFWLVLAFVGLSTYAWYHNQDQATIHFPPWLDHLRVPTWLIVAGSFLIGSVVTTIFLGLDSLGKSWEIHRLRRSLRASSPSSPPSRETGPLVQGTIQPAGERPGSEGRSSASLLAPSTPNPLS